MKKHIIHTAVIISFSIFIFLNYGDEVSMAAEGEVNEEVKGWETKYELGRALFFGRGVQQDVMEAARVMGEAAEAGYPKAMEFYGYMHLTGQGVPADEKKALEWFERSAEAGHIKGMINAGLLWRQAKTFPRSNEKGIAWLERASEAGSLEAKGILGRIYFTGDSLQPTDYKKAAKYLVEAAEGGDPVVQNTLAVAYRDGFGIEKNEELAEKLFRTAAEKNNAKAQANLGHMLGAESPASPNRKEALMWLLLAAEKGEPTAKKTLTEIQETIPGVLMMAAQAEARKKRMQLEAQDQSIQQEESKKSD